MSISARYKHVKRDVPLYGSPIVELYHSLAEVLTLAM